jgi:hypothetical protein
MDSQFIQAATQDFNLPHDIVPLPTGGIFYKNKKKSVKVGYLTANDENILLSGLQNNKDGVMINLLRSKLYEHDIRPEELLEPDIEAILIYLRNTSFGPEYTFSLSDPSNGKSFETTIVLDELNIKQTQYSPDSDGTFTTTLPKSGDVIKLKPLNYGELMEIDKMVSSYPPNRVAPKITWRLNKLILEINGSSDREMVSKYVDTMPILDSKYIRKFMSDNLPSLDLKKSVIAPSGEIVETEINFGVEFFRPFF